jgi:transcriptional regulator with XRE-family HTH domain
MSIPQRIQQILQQHHITPSIFADKIGVQRSNVSHVLSGRSKPGLDFLEKILNTFPDIDAHWLITGNENHETSAKESITTVKTVNSAVKPKEVVKWVEFYSDGTFQEYLPTTK